MKIFPLGTEVFQGDGQTDMTKLTVAFRNFANAPTDWIRADFLRNSHLPLSARFF